jgi:hypothetical protein
MLGYMYGNAGNQVPVTPVVAEGGWEAFQASFAENIDQVNIDLGLEDPAFPTTLASDIDAATAERNLQVNVSYAVVGPVPQGVNFSSATLSSQEGPGFGGARADGGPVLPGSSYLVGEQGPELFTPAGAGMISPNSGGGGQVVQVFLDSQVLYEGMVRAGNTR